MLVLAADPELRLDWPEGLRRAGWALDKGGDDASDAADLILLGVDGVRDPVRFLELRRRHEGIPIIVVTRVPLSALPEIREDVAAFVLPAFDGASPAGPRPRDLRFVATPAANVLDDLVGELCAREGDRVRTSRRSESGSVLAERNRERRVRPLVGEEQSGPQQNPKTRTWR